MKIEMDSESSNAIIIVAICAAVVAVSVLVYLDDIKPYDKGYTHQQLLGNSATMWVKKEGK